MKICNLTLDVSEKMEIVLHLIDYKGLEGCEIRQNGNELEYVKNEKFDVTFTCDKGIVEINLIDFYR